MDRTWVFHTECGKLGVVRKLNKKIILHIENGILSKSFEMHFGNIADMFDEIDEDPINCNTLNSYMINEGFVEVIHDIHECNYPGQNYPRIVRGNINFNYISNDFLQDMRAYTNIQKSLDDLFNYIEPVEINLKTFGHKIRELLILSCTEVEYLMKKMLIDNDYVCSNNSYLKTKDYFKCKDILKLDKYEVIIQQYADLKKFHPFKGWTDEGSRTTSSIPWYEAYNSVKHDRGGNIVNANFEHLLDAIAAIHILLEAQYGSNIFIKHQSLTDDNSLFITTKKPDWSLSEINAPLLLQGYETKFKQPTTRKYFEDNP